MQNNYSLCFLKNGEEIFFDFQEGTTGTKFDSEYSDVISETINGYPAYCATEMGKATVQVCRDGNVYTVFGSIELTRAKEIAASTDIF